MGIYYVLIVLIFSVEFRVILDVGMSLPESNQ